jgi:hypothetical protein
MEELPLLLAVPITVPVIAWVTARLSVLSALRDYYYRDDSREAETKK